MQAGERNYSVHFNSILLHTPRLCCTSPIAAHFLTDDLSIFHTCGHLRTQYSSFPVPPSLLLTCLE